VPEVRFSKAAEADLADIDEFSLARFGEGTAEVYMNGFTTVFARLADFPSAGPPVPEPLPEIRGLTYKSHRILYRMDGQDVLILRVLHHSRDILRHLSDDR
jgi:toxin ParE1/3/4